MDDVEPSPLLTAYFANAAAIVRFLTARLGDRSIAEDLSHDLYLKLAGRTIAEEVRDPAAYLFRMALNLARDYRRERQRAHAREADWASSRATIIGTEAVSDAPSAEAGYAARQKLKLVHEALEELSPQCRRAFVMHKFEGLSHEEVALRAEISRSTVEKHMRTAMLHLVKRLGKD